MLLTLKEQCTLHKNIVFLEVPRNSSAELENYFSFVKIIPKKNDNFDLTLRKRLFCNVKPTFLPRKTAAFGLQNNIFFKALIMK
ncbi:hypothetical protein CTM55_10245 [Prevotella intermedia]|nr:hypothetical protein CTM55_10245 [Prevotella intermedia]